MTFVDFLAQAGFWQWCGVIMLAAIMSQFRLFKVSTLIQNITQGDKK